MKKEVSIDELIRTSLKNLGLKMDVDFFEKNPSPCLKEALKGASKTTKAKGSGVPDFIIEKYKSNFYSKNTIPVIIENKREISKLEKLENGKFDLSQKSISDYALNGALHYANAIVRSESYSECIAIGAAGSSEEELQIKILYVLKGTNAPQILKFNNLHFLENQNTFSAFYKNITLSEEQKHEILLTSLKELEAQSKKLNKLMHSLNITAPQRVLYVSGMLLSMQNMHEVEGLKPQDLRGVTIESERDGVKITNRIRAFLQERKVESSKLNLMLSSFSEIDKDPQRDIPKIPDKEVAKFFSSPTSINKQIFTFIYKNIYSVLDKYSSHLDFIGELYSEFLKYALGDGKELGIVLTPPYVTKMMAELLDINEDSKVMDLATGSAGFLISAMQLMIEKVENKFGSNSSEAKNKIEILKKNQLLGVELNAEMFALAATNMILRGDGSSKIHKGNSFSSELESTIKDFEATRLLLNPPFTHEERGMPFIKKGLDNMPPHSLGAIIIHDSAGSGKAIKTNQSLLRNHTLLASIKMPIDLFRPMAGVQTSIYIFQAGVKHDFEKLVKFIDFRNDGYKRNDRIVSEIDNPKQRYSDLVTIYKQGLRAKIKNDYKDPMHLESIYIEDFIDSSGKDWNFEAHQKIDSKPKLEDFKKCVGEFLSFEVAQILKGEALNF